MLVTLEKELIAEAKAFAKKCKHAARGRWDFRTDKTQDHRQKMFEGKCGEKAVRKFFLQNNIKFKEDSSPIGVPDRYDFLVKKEGKILRVDVKTRTQEFHKMNCETEYKMLTDPKDLYIFCFLKSKNEVEILGFATRQDMQTKHPVVTPRFQPAYFVLDAELRELEKLLTLDKNTPP